MFEYPSRQLSKSFLQLRVSFTACSITGGFSTAVLADDDDDDEKKNNNNNNKDDDEADTTSAGFLPMNILTLHLCGRLFSEHVIGGNGAILRL